MKKFFLSFAVTILFCAKVFAADYYFVGVDAFKKGVYDKACLNLEHAVRINPKNVNARYYLAQTYLMQKRTNDAKEQYNRIILIAPASDAAILSEKGLHLIMQTENQTKNVPVSNNLLEVYKDNYIDYVLANDGKILKWAFFPVSVYIEPEKQKNAALIAFKQWQEKSKNLVSFTFVNSPSNAQITVYFKDKLEYVGENEDYITGFSKPYYQGNYLFKSVIYILIVEPDTNKEVSDDFITFSTLHEIGHSLGFKGHSPNQNDVMAATSKAVKTNLTQRDLNTLNLFYKINTKTLLARNKGQTDVQLQQAFEYVKFYPDKSVGWANLGDIYRNKKMYSDAIKNYRKAVSIEPDKAEFYNLLGSAYANTGDNKNAFSNLKKACDLDKSNLFYLVQFAKICLYSGQKEIGRVYINSFLASNPAYKNDEKIQNLLRTYK